MAMRGFVLDSPNYNSKFITPLGIVLVIGGYISLLAGIILNIDPISVGLNYLSGGAGNPGLMWIVAGVGVLILGAALLILTKENNSYGRKETVMISGVISIITLGALFIAAGGVLVFLGIQLNNALRHAWDLIMTYWSYGSFGSIDSNSGAALVFICSGAIIALIGIAFVAIGIIEAKKGKSRRAVPGSFSSQLQAEDIDPNGSEPNGSDS